MDCQTLAFVQFLVPKKGDTSASARLWCSSGIGLKIEALAIRIAIE